MAKVKRGLGRLGWALLGLSIAVWVAVPLSALALDAVLVISGLASNSPGGASENGIPVQSYSLGLENAVNAQSGVGGGTTSATVIDDLRIVKAVDGTSPELMWHALTQDLLTDATLYVGATSAKAGGAPPVYDFSIELSGVTVGAVEASGGLNAPTETIRLNFSEISVEHTSSGTELYWNLIVNKGSLQ